MSGFLTALNALASGANAGFKTADILKQQKQAQDDRDAADAETKRKLALFQATNQARFKLQNPDQADPTDPGQPPIPQIPDGGVGGLPFSRGKPGFSLPEDLPQPTPAPKPAAVFDPNVDYGAIGDVLNKNRELIDKENQTKATTEATAEYRRTLASESAARLAESTRQHNAGVAAAADISGHAPAARAYLKTQGYDDTGLPDSEAVQEAQRIQHDLIVQRNRPDVPGSFSVFNGTDGKPHLINAKTGQITDTPVGKASTGAGAKPDELSVLSSSIDHALAGRQSEPSGTGAKAVLPNFILDRVNPAGAAQRFDLGDVKSAAILLRDSKRASVAQMKQMEAMLPQASDPDAVIRTKLTNLKRLVGTIQGASHPQAPAGEDDFATWVKNH